MSCADATPAAMNAAAKNTKIFFIVFITLITLVTMRYRFCKNRKILSYFCKHESNSF
jgi:hypothetical protein